MVVSRGQTAIFLQGVTAYCFQLCISAHKIIESGVVPIFKWFLTPLSQQECVEMFIDSSTVLKLGHP